MRYHEVLITSFCTAIFGALRKCDVYLKSNYEYSNPHY